MSSMTASRTPRLTPPASPTRKAPPRRRTVGQGASVVCRADRPVLRIVADAELSPVFTRIGPDPSVERAPSVGLVQTTARKIDPDDFFASEWDGDDVAVEVLRPRPRSLGLTRRGRLVV